MTVLGLSPISLAMRGSGSGPSGPRPIIFAALGQSNMVGQPGFDGGSVHPAGTRQWGRVGADDGVLIDASVPLQHDGAGAGDMGLDIAFAERWRELRPLHEVVFVPSAVNGTSLTSGFWRKGGAGYQDAIARINACVAATPGALFGGFLWQQGESDAGNAAYQAQLDEMIADFREDVIAARPTTPFVLGEPGEQWALGDADRAAIRDVILDTPNRVPHTAVASSRAPTVLTQFDAFHFDAASLRLMGARHADAALEAILAFAGAPGAFAAADWSLSDLETGGAVGVNVAAVPPSNGSAIADIERRIDGGGWESLGLAAPGDAILLGLTDGEQIAVELRAVNGVGVGPVSDVKSATPTGTTVALFEDGAVGHWLLGADNPGHDGLIGGALTPVGAAPTLGSGVLSTVAGAGNGMESSIDAADEMTVCVVCSAGVQGNAILAGHLGFGDGVALYFATNGRDLYFWDRDGPNGGRLVIDNQPAGGMQFLAFSVASGDVAKPETAFAGSAGGAVISTATTGARSATPSKLGIGDTRFGTGSFPVPADFAEFIVFDSWKSASELEAIYQRSVARMADRGVTIL
ncbi:MAG: sialate O-acetylesterase [Pseudomonadota bacterium]